MFENANVPWLRFSAYPLAFFHKELEVTRVFILLNPWAQQSDEIRDAYNEFLRATVVLQELIDAERATTE